VLRGGCSISSYLNVEELRRYILIGINPIVFDLAKIGQLLSQVLFNNHNDAFYVSGVLRLEHSMVLGLLADQSVHSFSFGVKRYVIRDDAGHLNLNLINI